MSCKILLKSPYLLARRQLVQPLGRRPFHTRLDRRTSLILILLLSLGLWAVIWVVVGALAAVVG